jgi:hypothetical protein
MYRKRDWHMGRKIFLAGLIAAAFAAPAIANDAVDPMVWPKHQWRSDLFSVGSDRAHSHIVRVRHEVRRSVRVERHVFIESQSVEMPAGPRRAKLIRIGDDAVTGVSVNTVRQSGPRCSGMLILTWTGNGSTSRCHSGNAAVRH